MTSKHSIGYFDEDFQGASTKDDKIETRTVWEDIHDKDLKHFNERDLLAEGILLKRRDLLSFLLIPRYMYLTNAHLLSCSVYYNFASSECDRLGTRMNQIMLVPGSSFPKYVRSKPRAKMPSEGSVSASKDYRLSFSPLTSKIS